MSNGSLSAKISSAPSDPIFGIVEAFRADPRPEKINLAAGVYMEEDGVTPILAAAPDASVTTRPDGPHSGNPEMRAQVARGDAQVVSWAHERPDGGRGVGFTGGHYHANWGNEDFRRIVLNAILWLAKLEVPVGGVKSEVTAEDLAANLDHYVHGHPRA